MTTVALGGGAAAKSDRGNTANCDGEDEQKNAAATTEMRRWKSGAIEGAVMTSLPPTMAMSLLTAAGSADPAVPFMQRIEEVCARQDVERRLRPLSPVLCLWRVQILFPWKN